MPDQFVELSIVIITPFLLADFSDFCHLYMSSGHIKTRPWKLTRSLYTQPFSFRWWLNYFLKQAGADISVHVICICYRNNNPIIICVIYVFCDLVKFFMSNEKGYYLKDFQLHGTTSERDVLFILNIFCYMNSHGS